MFKYPIFDVEIVRRFEVSRLGWPARGEANDGSGLGGNLTYTDLRRFSWADAARILDKEQELIGTIELIADAEAETEVLEEEIIESERYLYGLDLGVAATVVALSAARCIPFSSCNGGAFGGEHEEKFPLAAFFACTQAAELLTASAQEADVALQGHEYLIAYANDVRKMQTFARSLIGKRALFDAIRVRAQRGA
jgi:hypothetical protein